MLLVLALVTPQQVFLSPFYWYYFHYFFFILKFIFKIRIHIFSHFSFFFFFFFCNKKSFVTPLPLQTYKHTLSINFLKQFSIMQKRMNKELKHLILVCLLYITKLFCIYIYILLFETILDNAKTDEQRIEALDFGLLFIYI